MSANLESLLSAVRDLPGTQKLMLLLDYDGTLVPIAPRPELAQPAEELLQLLSYLVAAPDLAVFIVSGRPVKDLEKLLPITGLNYLGSHGAEGLIMGSPWTHKSVGDAAEEQQELQRQIRQRLEGVSGWWIETKPWGFALHYRQASAAEQSLIKEALDHWLEQVSQAGRQQILRGKKVVEILPRGVSKGAALQEILLFPGFLAYFPIYLGDDVTDESAFQVLQARGLTVKVGGSRPSAATHSLADPTEVLQFLRLIAADRTDLL
jgi:trehalose 6-phosphate phosphatase